VSWRCEAPAPARLPQRRKFFAGEHRHRAVLRRRCPQSGHRVGTVLLMGEPAQEPADRADLVAGVRTAVLPQYPDRRPLHILLVHLLPPGLFRLGKQVAGGKPAHRLRVGVQRPRRLPLGGQVQPERVDLHCERPGVQVLRLRGSPPPDGESFVLVTRIRHGNVARNAAFRNAILPHNTTLSSTFPQVRGLRARIWRAPWARLERATYRLGVGEREKREALVAALVWETERNVLR
jgi:hypothetical protein